MNDGGRLGPKNMSRLLPSFLPSLRSDYIIRELFYRIHILILFFIFIRGRKGIYDE